MGLQTRIKYVMVGSDFSQQEPRLLANYSKDKNMIEAYAQGKDLYATIAADVYHNNYEDNKEFFADGTVNIEGKKRRTSCKTLLLGLLYGRGTPSIAEQLKTHTGEITPGDIAAAQELVDSFFNAFPNVKKWISDTEKTACELGYVEDLWGRRRRLPDIQLPEFVVRPKNSITSFNPIFGAKGIVGNDTDKIATDYLFKIKQCHGKQALDALKKQSKQDGIDIIDNRGFISAAKRQCVNARVQGAAATMTKLAMLAVYHDEELRRYKFKLLIAVHDELIGECPECYVEQVKSRLSYLMINSGLPRCKVPMKCDADSFTSWYADIYSANIKQEYKEFIKRGETLFAAFEKIKQEHSESTEEYLKNIIESKE